MSAASAVWILRARSPLTAMRWPLALGALVELSVGVGTAFNAHQFAAWSTPASARASPQMRDTLGVHVDDEEREDGTEPDIVSL